jgi:hypothetical protein
MVKQKTRAFVQGSFEAALRRKGWVWRLLSVTHLHTRGYVGQIQAEAKIFLSGTVAFSTLVVAWRIASDIFKADSSVESRSRDEAVIGG